MERPCKIKKDNKENSRTLRKAFSCECALLQDLNFVTYFQPLLLEEPKLKGRKTGKHSIEIKSKSRHEPGFQLTA